MNTLDTHVMPVSRALYPLCLHDTSLPILSSKVVVNTRHTCVYFTYLWHVNITHAAFVHFVNICTILTNNTTNIRKIRIRGECTN